MPQSSDTNEPRERRQRGDDPNQVADHLTEQYGATGAMEKASTGIADAQGAGDNYRLSIWREVRRILRGRAEESLEENDN